MPKIFSVLVGREIAIPHAELARRKLARTRSQSSKPSSASSRLDVLDQLGALGDSKELVRGLQHELQEARRDASTSRAVSDRLRARAAESSSERDYASQHAPRTLQPAPRKEDIVITPTFGMGGALQRVVFTAKGYDTVILESERDRVGNLIRMVERTERATR